MCAGEGGEKLSDEKPLQRREGIRDIAEMELSGISNGLFGFFSASTDLGPGGGGEVGEGMEGGADDSISLSEFSCG